MLSRFLAAYPPSAVAHSGWYQVGGTSLSSPIFALTYALTGTVSGVKDASSFYSAPSGRLFDVILAVQPTLSRDGKRVMYITRPSEAAASSGFRVLMRATEQSWRQERTFPQGTFPRTACN